MRYTLQFRTQTSSPCRAIAANQFLAIRRVFFHSQHTKTNNIHNEPPPPVKPKRSSLRGIAAGLFFCSTGWALNSRYNFLSFSSPQSLDNQDFTPFALVKKEPVSSTSAIFTLSQSHIPPGTLEEWHKKGVWSVEIKQPQLQIARAYTPLPPLDASDPDALRLLVRLERKGEVSGYLHRRPLGSEVEIRGPAVEYELPEHVSQVVFLAGGTGIAPAIQVAHALGNQARISVFWANRQREDCVGGLSDDPIITSTSASWYSSLTSLFNSAPPSQRQDISSTCSDKSLIVQQLDTLKHSNKALSINYFVDEENTFIRPQNVQSVVAAHQNATERQGKKIIFVSGPEGFMSYWAGPKQWLNGRQVQGALGGALAHMHLDGWQVVKL
jgi:hypothetical protein